MKETLYTREPYFHGDQPLRIPLEEFFSLQGRGEPFGDDIFFRRGITANGEIQIGTTFVNFESPHVHPIDLSPAGYILAVANTPDSRVELFDTFTSPPEILASIRVGVDPVTVRFRTEEELWVVNHISDTISIVDIDAEQVVRTLQTGDEPADVVFVSSKAYVTCSQENTVEVFDVDDLEKPSSKIRIEGEDPRSLVVSPDGKTIYAAVFESGNSSTILAGGITNEAMMDYPPNVVSSPDSPYEGQNPPPLRNDTAVRPLQETVNEAPAVSLIVRKDEDNVWRDGNGTDWTEFVSGEAAPKSGRPVGWDVVDNDIAMIDVATGKVSYTTRLMTIAMAMDVHPVTGEVLLVGTEARNEIRYEPDLQSEFSTVMGAIVRSDDEKKVFDLNPHLDYAAKTLPLAERRESIGDPRAVQYDAAGNRAYVAGMGSDNLAVLDSTGTRIGTIPTGEGPTGLALDAENNRMFVLNRFDASISVVDLAEQKEVSRAKFFDPTPYAVKRGRRVFYNTHLTSGLGQVSCATCHVDGRMDRLAWDLGNPAMPTKPERRFLRFSNTKTMNASPMKGPMVTQTLQDIDQKGPFHWRGDRMTLEDFNPTFIDLLGNDREMGEIEMADFKTFLASIHFPPNPYREDDNSLSRSVPLPGRYTTGAFGEAGNPLPNGNADRGFKTIFSRMKHPMLGNATCLECHSQTSGLAQTSRKGEHALTSRTAASQEMFKIVQLRNLYDKEGFTTASRKSLSGFGFFHDGSVDTLERFVSQDMFALKNDQDVADTVAFLLSFSGNGSSAQERAGWSSSPEGSESRESHSFVGTQVTLYPEESRRDRLAKIQTITRIARRGEIEAVATVAGDPDTPPVLAMTQSSRGSFITEDSRATFSDRHLSETRGTVNVTVVPSGQAKRIAFDRDGDLIMDSQENRDLFPQIPGVNNPFDPLDSDVTGDNYAMGADGVPDWRNDFDGDGEHNLAEFDAGTNPADGWFTRKPMNLTAEAVGDSIELSWTGEFKVTYQLQESADLLNWVDVPNMKKTSDAVDGGRLSVTVPSSRNACYFRIRVTK